jgi:hypothetical protein
MLHFLIGIYGWVRQKNVNIDENRVRARVWIETGFLKQQSRLSALVPEPETRFFSQLCVSPEYNKLSRIYGAG